MIQYADDTHSLLVHIINNSDGFISNTENELYNIKLFCILSAFKSPQNTMHLQWEQTILISNPLLDTNMNCDCVRIYQSTHVLVKNLGIYFETHVFFFTTLQNKKKSVMEILIFVKRISEHFDKTTWKVVVQSLVLSFINYCTSVRSSAG